MSGSLAFRLLALAMIAVISLTLLTPAKAEAEVGTALAIAGLAVAGVILVAYLIVATASDRRAAAADRATVWLACAEPLCPALPAPFPAPLAPQDESP
ncbi:MAG: hypothetical protein ACREJG_02840 [Candidatus Rokuibacteriota bacterium]